MGLIVLAAAVWALGTAWGLNNPGSKAAATLFFGGIGVFALWRPDVQWYTESSDNQDHFSGFRAGAQGIGYYVGSVRVDDD
jgi:hypothetical protein